MHDTTHADALGADALRVVLYSHDSVGLGHTRRNLAIAEALAAGMPEATGRPVSGLIISGASDAAQFPLPDGWDWLLVPGITKDSKGKGAGSSTDAVPTGSAGRDHGHRAFSSYVPRKLDVAPQRVRGLRSSVITGALLTFRPHLVVVDRHPFGADGELDEPLTEFRAQKPEARIVLGLREVLDDPVTAMREWEHVGVDRVADLYDELWVYGDRSVHDTIATGEIPPQLVHKTRFTGLLAADRPARADVDLPQNPFVVTMVGGGGDGAALAGAAATAPLPDGVEHLLVTGPQMPAADRMAVHSAAVAAGSRTRVVTTVPDGLACIRTADALIGMGGYNTVAEALATDTPMLVCPRVEPRTEQLIRARGLGTQGSLDWCTPARLSPETIGEWIASAVADGGTVRDRQITARGALRLDGLARVVEFAAGLATGESTRVRSLSRAVTARLGSSRSAPALASTPAPATGSRAQGGDRMEAAHAG
ncbi:MAG: glycosyltransferase family protein [Brevibacterium yomogidense]